MDRIQSDQFLSVPSRELATDDMNAKDIVNDYISSVTAAQRAKLKDCPIHENCDGSCSGPNSQVTVEPLVSASLDSVTTIAPNADSETASCGSSLPVPKQLEEFRYTPISSESPVIRLLRIKQAHLRIDPIECELVDVSLDATPEYAALSYHWGEPIFSEKIVCNGQSLAVTSNLHGALKRYRQDSRFIKNPLWVDAICINQNDKVELSAQLLLMRMIFKQAEVVNISLGDAPPNWYSGFGLMHRLSCVGKFTDDRVDLTFSQISAVYGFPPMDHSAWNAYFHLFSAPWFRRTWVIQEVVLARRGVVMYGDFDFDWIHLVNSFMFVDRFVIFRPMYSEERIRNGLMNMECILGIILAYHRTIFEPLTALKLTNRFDVFNLKDRIFAVLALLDATGEGFKPDYSLPVDQVYQGFAAHLVHTGHGIDMLRFAGLQYRASVLDIPSWAPDWSARLSWPNAMRIYRDPPFQAGGPSGFYTDVMEDYQNGQTMVVQGSLVDTITSLSSPYRATDYDSSSIKKLCLEWYESAEYIFQEATSSRTLRYDSCVDAFCRSLLAGNFKGFGFSNNKRHVTIIDPVLSNKGAKAFLQVGAAKSNPAEDDTSTYVRNLIKACIGRKFSITEKGFMGLVPNCAEVGDWIFIPLGSTVPFVLRAKNDNTFLLLGETYIHGIMDGEALDFPDFCPEKIVLS